MGHPIRGRQELSDLAAPRTGKQQLTNGGEPWVPAKEFEGRPSPFINLEKTELALIVMASVRIAAKVKPASCSTAALHIGQLLRSTPLRAIAKLSRLHSSSRIRLPNARRAVAALAPSSFGPT